MSLPPLQTHFPPLTCLSDMNSLYANDIVRGQKMLRYIADVIVNGPDPSLGAGSGEPALVDPTIPALDPVNDMPTKSGPSLRETYVKVR